MGAEQAGGALSGAAAGAKAGAVFGPWGAVVGGVVGGVAGALGSKKQKAPAPVNYTPVDIAEEQKRALAANASNFDAAAALTARGNAATQSQATALMEQAMPGFGALQKRLVAQVNADLNNQTTLPPEVQQQLQRFAAEKGVTRGTSGNFNGFSLVKDFGFNLLDYQQASRVRALNTLSNVFNMTPRINPMSPMAMMVSPETAIGVATQNHQMQYNAALGNSTAQAVVANNNARMTQELMQQGIRDAAGAVPGVMAALDKAKAAKDAKTSGGTKSAGAGDGGTTSSAGSADGGGWYWK